MSLQFLYNVESIGGRGSGKIFAKSKKDKTPVIVIRSRLWDVLTCIDTYRQRSTARSKKKTTQKLNQGNRQPPLHINTVDVDEVKRFDMLKSGHIRVLPVTSIKKSGFSFIIWRLRRVLMQLIARN